MEFRLGTFVGNDIEGLFEGVSLGRLKEGFLVGELVKGWEEGDVKEGDRVGSEMLGADVGGKTHVYASVQTNVSFEEGFGTFPSSHRIGTSGHVSGSPQHVS